MLTLEQKQEFFAACRLVVAAADDAKGFGLIQYAASYARRGFGLITSEEIRVQCLYILNNMVHWRGEDAKKAREVFKRLSKIKE